MYKDYASHNESIPIAGDDRKRRVAKKVELLEGNRTLSFWGRIYLVIYEKEPRSRYLTSRLDKQIISQKRKVFYSTKQPKNPKFVEGSNV